jgi:hypothetical protein
MWNSSQSPYLICYHGPKDIINSYEFDVELIAQIQTSMHGSKEQHMGYIYQRKSPPSTIQAGDDVDVDACDDVFRESWNLVQQGVKPLQEEVTRQLTEIIGSGRRTRSSRGRATL